MKRTEKIARQIIKENPRVDARLLKESMHVIDFIRAAGVKNRGFTIILPSGPALKIRPTAQKMP
jgi:hypothetical protein